MSKMPILLLATATACSSQDKSSPASDTEPASGDTGPASDDTGATSDDTCPDWTEGDYTSIYEPSQLEIAAVDLDSEADATTGRHHLVYLPTDRPLRDELFVLFPGSSTAPSEVTELARVAAWAGHRTVVLDYANIPSESELCNDVDTGDCQGEVLHERVYGEHRSDLVEVDQPNGVVGRLTTLLEALSANFETQGWEAYLDSGEVNWSRVVLAGGSQGGKVATYLSRDHEVARAMLISGTGSASRGADGAVELADWTLQPRATPPSRVFALWHAQEAADVYAPVILSSYGVDAYGPIVDTDDSAPPYDCSHMLRTNLLPYSGLDTDAHASLGIDLLLARDEDTDVPLLAPVWLYMATGELGD